MAKTVMHSPTNLQFVLKISKLCNLRCTYCYEYPQLGNRARMPLDRLRGFFRSINSDLKRAEACSVEFIWHGGEPLLIQPEYYAAIGSLQDGELSIPFTNTVQTNLTVLSDSFLELLKRRAFFRDIGVSFDVYGDQRIDIKGNLRTDTILGNLQRLITNKVDFGAICVLAKNTLPFVKEIYRFYDALRVGFRFLPFYRTSATEQIERHSLSFDEIVTALNTVFDEWLISKRATTVEPLNEYLDYAIMFLRGIKPRYYDKEKEESVFLVNPDGGIWGTAGAYDLNHRYGNAFEQDLNAVLASPARQQSVEQAHARMNVHCKSCPYFGACPGRFVGDATMVEESMIQNSGCTARAVISHIVKRLDETELTRSISSRIANQHPATRD